MTIAELRALFLSAPESMATRLVAVVVGLGVAGLILWLVRTGRLREEFTPLWLVGALGLSLISLSFGVLRFVTALIGAWTPSAAIFFLALLFLGGVSLAYAVRLSSLLIEVKNLAQEVAILRTEVEGSVSAGARVKKSEFVTEQPLKKY